MITRNCFKISNGERINFKQFDQFKQLTNAINQFFFQDLGAIFSIVDTRFKKSHQVV